jgi:uncharacterized membrane protein
MPSAVAAPLLGFIAGLRTFTAPAVLRLLRHPDKAAYVLAALAVAEYAGDLNPKAPPRTAWFALCGRALSGAYCGWALEDSSDAATANALLGATGAVVGAYVGLAARRRGMELFGAAPAALVEDLAAIAGAVLIVTQL